MLNKKNILQLCKKYNIKASKKFGQNFLINEEIIKKIINITNLENKDIVEIGPGLGSLTIPLINSKAKSITSYEVDKNMINVLQNEINNKKFNLINQDFLKSNFEWKNKKTLIANIPYNITSEILFKIYRNYNKFDQAIIMMQKEVAKRITAKTNNTNYSKLTISTNLFANVKYKFTILPNEFLPQPKVKSAIVYFKFKKNIIQNYEEFLIFIKKCFLMRRKTLINNWKKNIEIEKIEKIFKEKKWKKTIRPQEISFEEYLNIFINFIQK